jgi:hypothetical protein
VAVATCAVLAGCDGGETPQAGRAPGVTLTPDNRSADAGPADISRAKLSADGRTLILGFSAPPCQPVAAAEVVEALASVQVSVRLGKKEGCRGDAKQAWTTVTLANPLSGRLVIDTGRGGVIKVDGG